MAALVAAGCGDSGGIGGSNNSPAVNDAVGQCLQQAKQVKPADARKTAEEACKAAKTGDAQKVKNAARKQCLNAVKQIPSSAKQQKRAAKARCDAIK